MTIPLSRKLKDKILNDFREVLYKEINMTLDQFFYFFHSVDFEEKLNELFETKSVEEIKEYFHRYISIYKFFRMSNRDEKDNENLGLSLVEFLNDEQNDRKLKLNPPKPKRLYKPRKRKVYIDPNQLSFGF